MMATAGYREEDGCYPSEDPDGRRHLSTGPNGPGWPTSYSGQLSRPRSVALPSQVGPESGRPDSRAVLSVWWGKEQWTASGRLTGKLALHCAGGNQQRGAA